ncbi:hypothetical protein CMZ84_16010 [Lysobacteraceae bacterium NML93-0399]|nr:hypothetical protein CMZ84_16010 [Xanthomonadaceae bacterium NML93-0399]
MQFLKRSQRFTASSEIASVCSVATPCWRDIDTGNTHEATGNVEIAMQRSAALSAAALRMWHAGPALREGAFRAAGNSWRGPGGDAQ